jgi:glutamyl-tRNA reductase
MGAAIANVLATRCSELAIASRSREHAGAVASKLGVSALSLPDAAVCAPSARGVAVALSGPWSLDAATPLLPPTVDVSAPPALPATASVDYVGIDELLATCQRGDDAYVDRARWLVEAAVIAYLDSIQRRAEAV